MAQNDYQMALLLQQQFEHEANMDSPPNNLVYAKKIKNAHRQDSTTSLVDASWELVDPTPDIHILFMAFNEKYFWNKLLAVCVDWSKRMTTCAGVCSYQGRAGMCRITLSAPLLKLRPRKDLVETLLHEMIHAYLFVTNNNKDRDGHGPEFHKHMYRINKEAGTNITVYHDFHDEVRLYKQHWWRCNGPCQHRKPYFGMVRRATNRAPGPNDFWWGEHQRSCGGTYIKVQEPPKAPPKKKSGKENNPSPNSKNDIRSFYPVVKGKSPTSTTIGAVNGFNTTNKPGPSNSSNVNGLNNLIGNTSSASTSKSATNVVGFKDLNSTRPKNTLSNSTSTIVVNKKPTTTKQDTKQSDIPKPKAEPPKLSITAFSGTGRLLGNPAPGTKSDYEAVRNHWINKFPNAPPKAATKRSSSVDSNLPESPKRVKPNQTENTSDDVTCPVCHKKFPVTEVNVHLDHCLVEQEQSNVPESQNKQKCPICDQELESDVINKHVELCLSEAFNGTDEPTDDNSNSKPVEDLIPCLVCNKQIPRGELNSHLDECMGGDNIFSNSSNNCVDDSDDVNDDMNVKNDEDKKYNCPVCFELFTANEMCGHLDKCLLNDDKEGDGLLNSFLDEPF